eukprot:s6711_g1.t1
MLVLCLRCLFFLRLLLLLRTLLLLFRPAFLPVLCPFVGIQRAPGPSLGPGPTAVEWAVALPRIVEIKERVANVSAYDPIYALAWVEIPGGTRYEDLADECKYGMLENECNSAFRDCIKSIALKNKVQTETERMHTISRRLGSRQILWLHYDFLRPHVTGDSTFKLIDLVKTTIDRFTHGTEQERLEAFTIRWDHVLAGISVDRPDVKMLCALFYEQVREFRCLELDIQLWDRDESALTAPRSEDFASACVASFDVAFPSVVRKAVSFGDIETRMIESSFLCPSFGPVNREKHRAHMKAEMWREQVLLDDVDATTLGNDACVLELTLSKRSACEVFAAVVKTIKRVRRLCLTPVAV